ncbi:PepSY-associated TM helix domain-containing protein [Bacteroides reticulotermitis]|uniref:PepSY-associated TM helix domain-containing protein n=1 Tax=Bacteroides reticulotermitis TaxID=1133319 RepID=UPI003A88BFD1
MKKLFRNIHLWLSVPFGLIISIICLSGAALVFEDEITELCYPSRYRVENVGEKPLSVEQLMNKVAASLPDSVSVTGVSISSDPERAYQVSLSKPRRASVFVDQYTGEIKGKNERASFFGFMFRTHRWLLDSMKPDGGIFWGKMIVGTSTLLMVIVLISGIVIWWPRTRKALKNGLKITVNKGLKRFWFDLHVAGGMYALIFLLAMALTGLTWSFSWYRTAFYKVFGVEMQQQASHGPGGGNAPQGGGRKEIAKAAGSREGTGRGERSHGHGGRGEASGEGGSAREGHGERPTAPSQATFAYWQAVYDQLSSRNADYEQIGVTDGSATVSFNRLGNRRAADRYAFDPANGQITETNLYDNQDKSGKIRGWIYSVHVGSWGGLPTRILTFLAALIGASLPLTGYYLWIKKLVGKRKRAKKVASSPV